MGCSFQLIAILQSESQLADRTTYHEAALIQAELVHGPIKLQPDLRLRYPPISPQKAVLSLRYTRSPGPTYSASVKTLTSPTPRDPATGASGCGHLKSWCPSRGFGVQDFRTLNPSKGHSLIASTAISCFDPCLYRRDLTALGKVVAGGSVSSSTSSATAKLAGYGERERHL